MKFKQVDIQMLHFVHVFQRDFGVSTHLNTCPRDSKGTLCRISVFDTGGDGVDAGGEKRSEAVVLGVSSDDMLKAKLKTDQEPCKN